MDINNAAAGPKVHVRKKCAYLGKNMFRKNTCSLRHHVYYKNTIKYSDLQCIEGEGVIGPW
jgi:hypothetical protein